MASTIYSQLNQQPQNPNSGFSLQSIQQAQSDIQRSGMTAKDYFLSEARRRGMDPNPIIEQAQQLCQMM